MTLCVINAAEGTLDILLGSREGGIYCAQSWQAPTSGAELLTPALHSMLSALRLCPSDVGLWACVCGPGSFTGVRLALATVGGIRRITGAQNAALDYLQCLAVTGQRLASHPLEQEGHIWVLTHARRDLVHCQCFARGEKGLPLPLGDVELCAPVEAARRMLAESPEGSVTLGSGIGRNSAALAPALGKIRPLPSRMSFGPAPEDLWLAAGMATYHDQDLEPLYVRPCDAVDNLSHIARTQGMDPDKAHARLAALLAETPGESALGTGGH